MRDRGIETRIKRLEQTYGKINVTNMLGKVLDTLVEDMDNQNTPNRAAADRKFEQVWREYQRAMRINER